MGYTREQRAANAKKKAEAENKNTQKTDTLANNTVQETTKLKSVSKKKLKLEDDVLISVKSNVYGQLIYINHKTGDETRWEEYGEPQSLSVADLRAMKAKQLDFFKENWITILGIDSADDEYEAVFINVTKVAGVEPYLAVIFVLTQNVSCFFRTLVVALHK